jgi:hypothetical protein
VFVAFEIDGHGRNRSRERGRLDRLHGVHLESGFERACAIVGAPVAGQRDGNRAPRVTCVGWLTLGSTEARQRSEGVRTLGKPQVDSRAAGRGPCEAFRLAAAGAGELVWPGKAEMAYVGSVCGPVLWMTMSPVSGMRSGIVGSRKTPVDVLFNPRHGH